MKQLSVHVVGPARRQFYRAAGGGGGGVVSATRRLRELMPSTAAVTALAPDELSLSAAPDSLRPGADFSAQQRHFAYCLPPGQWPNYYCCCPPPANIRYGLTVLIHNSGHFGPPLPFWAPLPGLPLPMASYAMLQIQRLSQASSGGNFPLTSKKTYTFLPNGCQIM